MKCNTMAIELAELEWAILVVLTLAKFQSVQMGFIQQNTSAIAAHDIHATPRMHKFMNSLSNPFIFRTLEICRRY